MRNSVYLRFKRIVFFYSLCTHIICNESIADVRFDENIQVVAPVVRTEVLIPPPPKPVNSNIRSPDLDSIVISFPPFSLGLNIFKDNIRTASNFAGPNITPPPIVLKKNGMVDFSAFFRVAKKLLEESSYNNSFFIEKLPELLTSSIEHLCNKSGRVDLCRERGRLSISQAQIRLLEDQSKRFLYPREYYHVGLAFSRDLEQGVEDFFSNQCLESCGDGQSRMNISYIYLYGSVAQYTNLKNGLLNKSPSCRNRILSEIGLVLKKYQYPLHCNVLSNKRDKETCQQMRDDFLLVQNRTLPLLNSLSREGPYVENVNESCSYNSDFFSSQRYSQFPSLDQLESILQELNDYANCSEYIVGDQKTHTLGFYSGHRVTRELEGHYTASFAVEFSPREDYDNNDIPRGRAHEHYLQMMRGCMKEVEPYLLGKDGERLRIDIVDARKRKDHCLPIHKIAIKSSRNRSNAIAYASDINCQSMTHEVFHIVGDLQDEYREVSSGMSVNAESGNVISSVRLPKYNCRVSYENSIMGRTWERFFNVREGRNTSLLDPSHFNAILYGDCRKRDDVKLYRECSSLSTLTSYDGTADDCPALKQRCERENVLGR